MRRGYVKTVVGIFTPYFFLGIELFKIDLEFLNYGMLNGKVIELASKSVLFSAVLFAVGVGIVLFYPDASVTLGIMMAIGFVVSWGLTVRYRWMLWGVIGVGFYAVGVWMGNASVINSDISNLRGKDIIGTGVVIDDPSLGTFVQRVLVKISHCEGGDRCGGERVIIEVDRWQEIRFGDVVRFSCTFERPENFSEDFDYRMYLASRGVQAMCKKAEVSIAVGQWTVLGTLGRIRRTLEESVDQSIEQPYSALGNGLLFGGSSRMSDQMAEDFSKTSMTHIVAVSGYNVSLIAGYVFILAIYLGFWRKGATVVAIAGIVLFVMFIGSPSSAIRAGVMGSILLFALALGRSRGSTRVLLYAGVIMVAMNPLILRYDVGFQLSFLATLGIVAMAPWYERVRPSNGTVQGITEIIFMTTAAQIFVLPVILLTFHSFSLLAIVVNLLVLWTIPFAMLLTFLSSISGLIFGWLGFAVGVGAQGILWYDISMVQWFAKMDWSVVNVDQGSVWFLVLWYMSLGFITGGIYWREQREIQRSCRRYKKSISFESNTNLGILKK